MRNKILSIVGSALLLAACETTPNKTLDVGTAPTAGTAQDFKLNIKDRVFFGVNKSCLSADARKTLDAQAGWLKTYTGTNAVIEGHCDEKGTSEYNKVLGAHRAASVVKELGRLGVSTDRLKAVSYGEENPLVSGTGPEVRKQNRAAVTVIQ